MISRGQRIRDYLREQDRPCAPAEIAKALGLPVLPVCHTIGNLFRAGMLDRTGAGHSYHYFLKREAKPAEIYTTPEAKKARCAELARLAHKAKGGMSRAEYFEQCAARSAASAATRQPRIRKKVAAKPRPPAAPKARKVPKPVRTLAQRFLRNEPPIPVVLLETVVVKAPRQSVDEFLARGGHIDVLPAAWNQARAM